MQPVDSHKGRMSVDAHLTAVFDSAMVGQVRFFQKKWQQQQLKTRKGGRMIRMTAWMLLGRLACLFVGDGCP